MKKINNNLVTKDHLNKALGKTESKLRSEMQEMKTELCSEIHRVGATLQAQINRIDKTITTKVATKDDINRIMTSIDKFAAQSEAYRKQDIFRGNAVMEHDEKLKDHETRLQKLETR